MNFLRLEWVSIYMQKKFRNAETIATIVPLDPILQKKNLRVFFLREEILLTSPPPHKIKPLSNSKHSVGFQSCLCSKESVVVRNFTSLQWFFILNAAEKHLARQFMSQKFMMLQFHIDPSTNTGLSRSIHCGRPSQAFP